MTYHIPLYFHAKLLIFIHTGLTVFNLDVSQARIFPKSVESPMKIAFPAVKTTTCEFPTVNSVLYVKEHQTASPKVQ